MALRWFEGFETRQHTTYHSRLYSVVSGDATSYPTGRKIGSAARSNAFSLTTPALVASVGNTWTIGFGLKVETVGNQGIIISNGTGPQMLVQVNAGTTTGAFTLVTKRDVTTLATSPELLIGKWYYVEIQAVVRTSTNGSVAIKIDGAAFSSVASVNTAFQAIDGADRVTFSFGSGGVTNMDDIYVRDDSTYLGPQVIAGALANGDGASLQWTPSTGSSHFALVDDSLTSPSDSDDNSSNVDGDVDLYEFANMTTLATAATINGVAVVADMKMKSSGAREVNVRYRASGGSTGDFDTFEVGSRSFTEVMTIEAQNPQTAAPWTKTEIDGGQFGIVNIGEV